MLENVDHSTDFLFTFQTETVPCKYISPQLLPSSDAPYWPFKNEHVLVYVAGQAQQSDRRTAVVMGRTRVMNGKTLEIGRTHEGSGKTDGMAGRTAVVMGRLWILGELIK